MAPDRSACFVGDKHHHETTVFVNTLQAGFSIGKAMCTDVYACHTEHHNVCLMITYMHELQHGPYCYLICKMPSSISLKSIA